MTSKQVTYFGCSWTISRLEKHDLGRRVTQAEMTKTDKTK